MHWPQFKSRLVKTSRPRDVTSIHEEAEVEPREVGLNEVDVAAIWHAVERLYLSGIQPSIGFCLRKNGKVVIDRAIGHTHGNEPGASPAANKRLATPQSLFSLFSSSKAITAVVMHKLDELNLLRIDDPIVEYIPNFHKHGKANTTLRHVLYHKAGLPYIPDVSMDLSLLENWDRIIALLCDAEPTAPPGRKLEYHSVTGGFICGEIAKRVTGKDIRTLLDEYFCRPLGLKQFNYGVPENLVANVAPNVPTGPLPGFPVSLMFQRAFGLSFEKAIEASNDPRFLTGIIPSANIVSTANETCKFFDMLLNFGELNGVRVLEKKTVRRAIAEQTYAELDTIIMAPFRYSLGFMLGTDPIGLYGFQAPNAFGHLGFTNIIAWADPDRNISCALLCPGKPVVTLRVLWWLNVMNTVSRRCPRQHSQSV